MIIKETEFNNGGIFFSYAEIRTRRRGILSTLSSFKCSVYFFFYLIKIPFEKTYVTDVPDIYRECVFWGSESYLRGGLHYNLRNKVLVEIP